MTAIERTAYPRFKQSFTEQELATFYTPTEEDIAFVNETASGRLQRLTLMTLLKSFQKLGYLPQWNQIPEVVKDHIAFHADGAPRRKMHKVASTTRSRYRQAIHAYLHIKPYRQGRAQVVTSIVYQVAETMSDPAEYEKRIKYKDLIANAIMLQNVVDMTNVLHDLVLDGCIITPEIVATFSPYLTGHIKRFGEYVIDVETKPPPLQPDKLFLTPEVA